MVGLRALTEQKHTRANGAKPARELCFQRISPRKDFIRSVGGQLECFLRLSLAGSALDGARDVAPRHRTSSDVETIPRLLDALLLMNDECGMQAEGLTPQVVNSLAKQIRALHNAPPEGVKFLPEESTTLTELHAEITGPGELSIQGFKIERGPRDRSARAKSCRSCWGMRR